MGVKSREAAALLWNRRLRARAGIELSDGAERGWVRVDWLGSDSFHALRKGVGCFPELSIIEESGSGRAKPRHDRAARNQIFYG